MSFDIVVEHRALPGGLRASWQSSLAREGFEVEICPDFQPATWEGGFLPMKVISAPEALIGLPLDETTVSGCEVRFDEGEGGKRVAAFRFGDGGPTTEHAIVCMAAALLAELTNGTYVDPQAGTETPGREAVAAAKATIGAFLENAGPEQFVHHAFPGWAELGVEVEP